MSYLSQQNLCCILLFNLCFLLFAQKERVQSAVCFGGSWIHLLDLHGATVVSSSSFKLHFDAYSFSQHSAILAKLLSHDLKMMVSALCHV